MSDRIVIVPRTVHVPVACRCGGTGYTEEHYVVGILRLFCACPAGVAYKVERMKAMPRIGAAA